MPLDEREQRILEEIEAQFYQEDPHFAQTVRDTSLRSITAKRARFAVVGLVVGLVLMLAFFTRSQYVALGGFGLMVASGAWIVAAVRGRGGSGGGPMTRWVESARRRWRRGR